MSRKFARTLLILLTIGIIFQEQRACAQKVARDTLSITIKEAEAEFLQNNLSLLAGRFNIDHAKAEVITAGLFNNPEFGFENILFNPETKKFFDMSYDGGQYTGSISQLFVTAGKRNKNINLAKIGVKQSEYEFFDLLRTLKYTLRTDFYKIYYKEQSAKVYQEEINSLSTTLAVFNQQYQKGNIAQNEVLRIQSQLYTLQTELNDLRDEIDDVQSEFKLLIRVSPQRYILPKMELNIATKNVLEEVPYKSLLDSAYANRYDLKIAKSAVDYSNLNLKLQHAMAIPDITVGLTFDKLGSTVRNYSGLGVSIPLPLFNRNQGGIKQAKIAIKSSMNSLQQQKDEIESELDNSFQAAFRLERLYNSFDPKFTANFTHLIEEVAKNYQKRNISLLEFLDFYDSYKTNTLQMNSMELNRINSLEELNFITGTQFFNK
ncbi:MAG: TolC family protein [Candidatus Pedobacter colombiensis]|uniref:TolC family protein n=1 Tax=Candidatus Pedobacter colombiensis TaxID=3121371 RepID=A0AAJ5WCK8_9SPHI|nr:TolC family protein [Pedobacter sp.]WEK21568.1 MAG: TolC family protein [Pedobacter sp.]